MINDYMMFNNLPELDLHGCDRYEALVKIKEFINDNYKLGNKLLKIVHGKGEILKDITHKELKINKLVIDYKIDIFNGGCTIVEIKRQD